MKYYILRATGPTCNVIPSAGPPPPACASFLVVWLLLHLLLLQSAPPPGGWWRSWPSHIPPAAEPAAAEPSSEHCLPHAVDAHTHKVQINKHCTTHTGHMACAKICHRRDKCKCCNSQQSSTGKYTDFAVLYLQSCYNNSNNGNQSQYKNYRFFMVNNKL